MFTGERLNIIFRETKDIGISYWFEIMLIMKTM